MNIGVIMFGIAQEIFGKSTVAVECSNLDKLTAGTLKSKLETIKPALKELGSYMIAVNNEYADDNSVINEKDEVALIPPVSGG